MPPLRAIVDRLALEPVVLGLLGAMVLLRVAVALSLRGQSRPPVGSGFDASPSLRQTMAEWLDAGLIAVCLVFLVIRPFVAQIDQVTSGSMEPTLHGSQTPQIEGPNDRLLVNKYLYLLRPPRRRELVVFQLPHPDQPEDEGSLVKRVIALPGDTVAIDDHGEVVLNGVAQREPYIKEVSDRVFPPQRVPPGCLFVLGDNRNASRDSSRWTRSPFLPLSQVRGKAVAVCWPPDRMKLLP